MKIQLNSINYNTYNKYASVPFRSNFYTDSSVNMISDLKQHNEYYCAPTCAANALLNLASKGNFHLGENFENLIEGMAKTMKTSDKGTTSNNMCAGLDEYVRNMGYNCKIKYQGFRDVNPKYKRDNMPSMAWIKNELDQGKSIIVNIGIYKKVNENGKAVYKRDSGHYINVIGYGSNGIAKDPNCLTITDPYNKVQGNHYIKLNKIEEGKFVHNPTDDEVSLTNNAKGFYEITPRFNYFDPDEIGVLNAAVSVEVI